VTNLRTAVQRIYLDTGRWPNTMVIPFDAVGVIENHPRVVARFQNFALMVPNAWQHASWSASRGNEQSERLRC
jgi:hypothetical protein